MIQLSAPIVQGYNWKNQLSQAVKDPVELVKLLELPDSCLPGALLAHQLFPLRVPRAYLARIKKGDSDDPLLRQILPLDLEAETVTGYSNDPVGDIAAQKTPGLLHKYRGRALMIASSVCAINCSYCFRRNFPYTDTKPFADQWQRAQHYLSQHTDIKELILSGGDPLSLSDERLQSQISALEKIPHIEILRIHTRLPIVIPHRITELLLSTLSNTRLKTVIVVHINHANEIDDSVRHAMARLRDAGVTLLNQSVLLRHVNDSVAALEALSQALFKADILPYYLHQLDRVNGAAHFAVDKTRALQLIRSLLTQLPGYLVPKLVEERAGEPSKIPLL